MADVVEPSVDPGPQARAPTETSRDDEPVLPRVTRDEAAGGWGERRDDERLDGERSDDEWYLHERPPHHEG